MSKTHQIGDLASRFDVPVETIRYFEKKGLLAQPARTEGNYRLYTEAHAERLGFILNCRALDMTHSEIKDLLRLRDEPDSNCNEVNQLLDQHIGHVEERIRTLRGLQKQLKVLRDRCNTSQASKDCGILGGLSQPSSKVVKRSSNLGAHSRPLGESTKSFK